MAFRFQMWFRCGGETTPITPKFYFIYTHPGYASVGARFPVTKMASWGSSKISSSMAWCSVILTAQTSEIGNMFSWGKIPYQGGSTKDLQPQNGAGTLMNTKVNFGDQNSKPYHDPREKSSNTHQNMICWLKMIENSRSPGPPTPYPFLPYHYTPSSSYILCRI